MHLLVVLFPVIPSRCCYAMMAECYMRSAMLARMPAGWGYLQPFSCFLSRVCCSQNVTQNVALPQALRGPHTWPSLLLAVKHMLIRFCALTHVHQRSYSVVTGSRIAGNVICILGQYFGICVGSCLLGRALCHWTVPWQPQD